MEWLVVFSTHLVWMLFQNKYCFLSHKLLYYKNRICVWHGIFMHIQMLLLPPVAMAMMTMELEHGTSLWWQPRNEELRPSHHHHHPGRLISQLNQRDLIVFWLCKKWVSNELQNIANAAKHKMYSKRLKMGKEKYVNQIFGRFHCNSGVGIFFCEKSFTTFKNVWANTYKNE